MCCVVYVVHGDDGLAWRGVVLCAVVYMVHDMVGYDKLACFGMAEMLWCGVV